MIRILLVTCVVAVSCTGDEAVDGFRLDETESGVPWARNTGAGSWTEDERWTARVAYTLGRVDGDGPDVFGRLWDLAVDSEGKLFVLDALAQEVRVFDAEGAHLHTWGNRGAGPGEFGYADGITLDAEGNVWVYDPRNTQLARFRPDGTWIDAVRRIPVGSIVPWPAVVLEDRTIVDWQYSSPERDYSENRSLGSRTRYQPVRVSVADGAVDTFPSIDVVYPMVGRTRVPLSVRFTFAQAPDGTIWFGHSSEYTLYHRTLTGDTLLIVSLEDGRPVPVTDAEADSIVRAYSGGDLASSDVPGRDDLPEHRPVLYRILLDGAGHVLVFPELEGYEPGTMMEVFDVEAGRYLGRVELPVRVERLAPAEARAGHLYVVVRGAFDVHQVVRLDLRPSR